MELLRALAVRVSYSDWSPRLKVRGFPTYKCSQSRSEKWVALMYLHSNAVSEHTKLWLFVVWISPIWCKWLIIVCIQASVVIFHACETHFVLSFVAIVRPVITIRMWNQNALLFV
jgi:hypothetical protein